MMSGSIQSLRLKNYDIVIVSSPPLLVGLIGVFYSKINSKAYWLDLRDLWPDSVVALGQIKKKSVLFKLAKFAERLIYDHSRGFILAVPDFKNYLDKNYNYSIKPKLDLINGLSKNFIKESELTDSVSKKRFTVLFSGNIGLAQKLETVIDAACHLKKLPIDFVFIGSGVRQNFLKSYAKEKKLKNVYFKKIIPRKNLIAEIKKSSICIAPLAKTKLFENAIPSKIFEYLACKKPVICNYSSAGKIINEIRGGKVVESENSKELADAIRFYFENQFQIKIDGTSGYEYVRQKLIKENLIDDLLLKMRSLN